MSKMPVVYSFYFSFLFIDVISEFHFDVSLSSKNQQDCHFDPDLSGEKS